MTGLGVLGQLFRSLTLPVLEGAFTIHDRFTGYDREREYQAQVARMNAWTDGTD